MKHTDNAEQITIGIDIGTRSVKAVAALSNGEVVGRSLVRHRLVTTGIGAFEHDAREAWVNGPLMALQEIVDQLNSSPYADLDILGICVAAMAPSMCAVDAEGVPISPGILYGDYRGRDYYTGVSPVSGEARGFLESLIDDYPAAHAYWPAQAVANYALTGRAVIDSFTAIAHGPLSDGNCWNEDLLADIGVEISKMAVIKPSGHAVGRVSLGIGVTRSQSRNSTEKETIVLASGLVDSLGEQMATGTLDDGEVLVVLGSTLLTWQRLPVWKETEGLWSVPDLFNLDGGCLTGGASNAGGIFIDWVINDLLGGSSMTTYRSSTDPRSVPVWAPYPRGERTPLHDFSRRAAVSGLGLEHTSGELIRGAYEASGFVVRRNIEMSGYGASRILATGGGINSDEWLQALADCTGLPVDVVVNSEGAALGAAFMARIACGLEPAGALPDHWQRVAYTVEPNPDWLGPCSQRYEIFMSMAG